MSAFSAAIDALFADANMTEAAEYLTDEDPPVACRIRRRAPQMEVSMGRLNAVLSPEEQLSALAVEVRVSEIPTPEKNAAFRIDDQIYRIVSVPRADTLKLVWRISLGAPE